MATIIRSYEANTRMMKQNSEMLQEILRQVKLLAAHLGIMDEGEIRGDGKTNLGIVSLHLVVLVGIIVEYKNQYQHVAEAKYGCHVLIIDSITGGFEAGISKVGQTRKHVLLAFSIGVKRMIYCCNKMDATILNYSKASFEALYSDNIRKNVAVEDLKRDHALSVIVITQAHVMELVYGMLEKVEDDAPSRETRWIRGLGRGPQEQLVPSSSETSISVA
ncbi:hypothetical protein V6N12_043230 [Hibiscus sabdariffa]|uniref:Tr-type G domain-containing protein n=1 Tax=Hibiscus sabdariffa TaxID=183260 RepID=A0ABR2DDP3_9ROSI